MLDLIVPTDRIEKGVVLLITWNKGREVTGQAKIMKHYKYIF
jgi:hypothetical protein